MSPGFPEVPLVRNTTAATDISDPSAGEYVDISAARYTKSCDNTQCDIDTKQQYTRIFEEGKNN
jgi:hypothetical protein